MTEHHLIEPERRDLAESLRQQGYCMIDRTVKVTIPLKESMDFARYCRIPLEIQEGEVELERISEIAEDSFLLDSRFMPTAQASEEDIRREIRIWVERMQKCFVCRCKGEIAGFLELSYDESHPAEAEIKLAAVDAKYRVAGVALSLYAGVARFCREQGLKRLWGRTSSRNMPVVNLYATLGASFSLPLDVYARSNDNA